MSIHLWARFIKIYFKMKKMQRQNSPQNLMERSGNNELFSYKMDPFTKSFRKKYQVVQPSTVNSTANLIKTFSKNRIKPAYPPKDSPNKIERRSSSKNHHSRQIEKISLTAHTYHQANAIATTSKLLKISNIFCRKIEGQPQDMLSQLYEQNEEYLELLLEWQRLQIYDEIDKLIYKISQSYTKALETILAKTYKSIDSQLQRYEVAIEALEEQNQRLKKQSQLNEGCLFMFEELQGRVASEYHKNQWSSIILQAISKAKFDLEAFVKSIPVYRSVILGENIVKYQQPSPQQPMPHLQVSHIQKQPDM